MKLEKYKRPNPEGPHIVIRSRALPDRQWGVFTHLAQWKTLLPFMIPFNCHLGKPFPELRRSSWICPPRSPGPLMPHPFISQIVLYSKEQLCSLAPYCTVSYLRKKHILLIFYTSRAEPRLAHNVCKYLKMFNSLVEWFARDFKQGTNFQIVGTDTYNS